VIGAETAKVGVIVGSDCDCKMHIGLSIGAVVEPGQKPLRGGVDSADGDILMGVEKPGTIGADAVEPRRAEIQNDDDILAVLGDKARVAP